MGLDSIVGELRDLIQSYNPLVVFLGETKKREEAITKLRWSLGYRHGQAVNCVGRIGGLALWWRDSIDVTLNHGVNIIWMLP